MNLKVLWQFCILEKMRVVLALHKFPPSHSQTELTLAFDRNLTSDWVTLLHLGLVYETSSSERVKKLRIEKKLAKTYVSSESVWIHMLIILQLNTNDFVTPLFSNKHRQALNIPSTQHLLQNLATQNFFLFFMKSDQRESQTMLIFGKKKCLVFDSHKRILFTDPPETSFCKFSHVLFFRTKYFSAAGDMLIVWCSLHTHNFSQVNGSRILTFSTNNGHLKKKEIE